MNTFENLLNESIVELELLNEQAMTLRQKKVVNRLLDNQWEFVNNRGGKVVMKSLKKEVEITRDGRVFLNDGKTNFDVTELMTAMGDL